MRGINLRRGRNLLIAGGVLAAAVVTIVAGGVANAAAKAYYLPYPKGVSYRINQGWNGAASHNKNDYVRYAIDINMSKGSTVVASAPGVVYDSYLSTGGWGETVVVKHPWGECTRYSHLSVRKVTKGQTVKQGQLVGLSGATGEVTGPHLDFKVENCATRVSIKWAVVEYSGSLYDTTITGKTLTSRNPGPKVATSPGTDTVGMWDPADHSFHLAGANTAGNSKYAFAYGAPGDLPVVGDWNGDGKDTIGVYRFSDHGFHLSDTNTTGSSDHAFTINAKPGEIPIAGDWNGDGKDTVGFYDPSDASFHLFNKLQAATTSDIAFIYGAPTDGDIPVVGDWNGDGKDTVGYYSTKDHGFHLTNTLGPHPHTDASFTFGTTADQPLTGDWNGDGRDTVGVYRPTNTTFYLTNTLTPGTAPIHFTGGKPTQQPTHGGDWDNA